MTDYFTDFLFSPECTSIWEETLRRGLEKEISPELIRQHADPAYREDLKRSILAGEYRIAPAREARIPKDDGTMRTVWVSSPRDRILLAAVNSALFQLCPDMVHPACLSYRTGTGCAAAVRQISRSFPPTGLHAGFKLDLSKYFDSVPLPFIENIFDQVERTAGKSAVLDMLRRYWRDDTLIDIRGRTIRRFTSLRQGCAVSAFLADAVLKPLDETMSALPGITYCRYSDDILILGADADAAFRKAEQILASFSLALNPKKVEHLRRDRWFTFLGYALRENRISLSAKRLRNFQKAVRRRTLARKDGCGPAFSRVMTWFYSPFYTGHSCAEGLFSAVNCPEDLRAMDRFMLDCIRACGTGKCAAGGLGWENMHPDHVITRGLGRNVAENRRKIPKIPGYVSMVHLQNLYRTDRDVYDLYVRQLCPPGPREDFWEDP